MGMVLVLKRASDPDQARLHACPKAIHRFVSYGEDEEDFDEESTGGWLTRLLRPFQKPGPKVSDVVFDSYAFDDEFDADKAWHGLYFLLTGTADEGAAPVRYLLNAPSIGKEDVGYGPAMAIVASRTAELSAHLNALDRAAVLGRFDAKRMIALDIYPNIWDDDEGELKAYLGDAFDALKAYCQKCADHGLGMVSYIT
ncbi:YfbM family protein [Asticcacaulis sp. AND118]|uniref:YfbM family protein n=1 Tax=Asticcacaulis sp. AND118 TaxID=2840468 RepID=UPI001CFFAFC6|nr:YfbM family protein [Asticcacaulis sp. AND118]UDF03970.1 YfbM family protein [Asticcacaulis sp. AND118]